LRRYFTNYYGCVRGGCATYIRSSAATTNFSADATIDVGESNAATRILRTLIKPYLGNFGTLGLSKKINIVSVKLGLFLAADFSSNARDFKVYRLLRNWVESEATWNIYSTGNNWNTAGAGGSGTDYDSTVLATTNFLSNEAVTGYKEFNISVSEFKMFLDGTYPYYGFLIKADTETDDMYQFHGPNTASPALKPYLVVEYYML